MRCRGILVGVLAVFYLSASDALFLIASEESARPKVGVAFSGGGARGAAHIGVLRVLERERIPIDYIAGTSFGALVGGLYALGYSAEEIEAIFLSQKCEGIFDDSPRRAHAPIAQSRSARYMLELEAEGSGPQLPAGLVRGEKLTQILSRYTAARMAAAQNDFDRLPVPFRAVATDILTGRSYLFSQGSMAEALRASISMPGLFTPVEKDRMLLVDGGISNNLPCDVVREMGADIVIAVDTTSPSYSRGEIKTLFKVLDQVISLQMRRSVEENLKQATLVIRPDLEGFTYADYHRLGEIIARGTTATQAKVDELRKLTPAATGSSASWRDDPLNRLVIRSIEFEGLDDQESRAARKIVESRLGEPADPARLSGDLERLIASGKAGHADYLLTPDGDGHVRVKFRATRPAVRTVGLSMRFDPDYKFVVLGEYNARRLFGTPSAATFSSQFGGLQNHGASLRLVSPRIPHFYLEPSARLRRQERNDAIRGDQSDTYSDRRVEANLRLGAVLRDRIEASGGYQIQRVTIRGGTTPFRGPSAENLAGLTLRLRCDTLDHQEFPDHGTLVDLQWHRRLRSLGSSYEHTILDGDILRLIPLRGGSALDLHFSGSFAKGDLPFYERAYVGGFSFSESASRRFIGFGKDALASRQFMLLGATYRQQILSNPTGFLRRGYLTLDYNVAGSSESRLFMKDYQYHHGAGLGFAVKTPYGPVRVGTGFGAGKPRIYFSIGPSF